MEQNKYHAYDVWRHGMECMDACAGRSDPAHRRAPPRRRQAADARVQRQDARTTRSTITSAIGAEIADPICQRLRFSNDERARIVASRAPPSLPLLRRVDGRGRAPLDEARRQGAHRRSLRLNEADVRAKGRDARRISRRSPRSRRTSRRCSRPARRCRRAISRSNGRDLMKELGLAPGPISGEMLEALLEAVIARSRDLNERDNAARRQKTREMRSVALVRARKLAGAVALGFAAISPRARGLRAVAAGGADDDPGRRLAARADARGPHPRRVPARSGRHGRRGSARWRRPARARRVGRVRARAPRPRRRARRAARAVHAAGRPAWGSPAPTGVLGTRSTVSQVGSHEAWVEARTSSARPWFLRIGRQALTWGDGRLLGGADWSPVGRALDAARAHAAIGDHRRRAARGDPHVAFAARRRGRRHVRHRPPPARSSTARRRRGRSIRS